MTKNLKILLVLVGAAALFFLYTNSGKSSKSKNKKKSAAKTASASAKTGSKSAASAQPAAQSVPAEQLPPPPPPPPPAEATPEQQAVLIELAAHKNTEAVKRIINENVSPDFTAGLNIIENFPKLKSQVTGSLAKYIKPDAENFSLAFIAVASGNDKLLDYLISKKANLNVTGPDGKDLLETAIESMNVRTAGILIDAGIAVDFNKNYILQVFKKGNKDFIKIFLVYAKKQNIDLTPYLPDLPVLVKTGDMQYIRLLLSEKYFSLNTSMSNGMFPMHYAAELGKEVLVKEFALYGGNINALDEMGRTPLFYAASDKAGQKIVQYLIDNGEDVNIADEEGVTALMTAIGFRQENTVKLLMSVNGIDVNTVSKAGRTPLLLAAQYADAALVTELIAKKAAVNIQTPGKDTPLIIAARRGNYAMVKTLLDAGASDRYKNSQGYRASELAAQKGFVNISDLINARSPQR